MRAFGSSVGTMFILCKRNRRGLIQAPVSDRTLLEDSARLCTCPIGCDTTLKEWKFKSFQLADPMVYWRKSLCRGLHAPEFLREHFRLIPIDDTLIAVLGEHIFRSTDNGESWSEINEGLTGHTVTASAVMGEKLLIATNKGLFRINKNGKSWESLRANVIGEITALALNRTSLIAGTSTSADGQSLADLFTIDLAKNGPSERLKALCVNVRLRHRLIGI
jgi:hypothetical protein